MAPEYGATCGFFGIDDKTLDYLRLTGRGEEQIALVEAYARAQGLWLDAGAPIRCSPTRSSSTWRRVVPSLAGPKRPQDKVALRRGRRGVQRQPRPANTAIKPSELGRASRRSTGEATTSATATW